MAIADTGTALRNAAAEESRLPSTLTVSSDLTAAAPLWDRLSGRGLGTPFQTRAFVAAWLDHLGDGAEPLIVTGESEWGEGFVLPLVVRRVGPARIACFAGGSHANTNVGLFDPGVWARFTVEDVRAVYRAIAEQRPDVDLVELRTQPVRFGGRDNPFVDERSRPSPHMAYAVDLAAGFDDVLARHRGGKKRSALRKREKGLSGLGGLDASRAATPALATAALDVFFTQKAERFRQQGLPDVFADDATRAFFRALCGDPAIVGDLVDMHTLTIDGAVVATTLLLCQGGTAYLLMNSFCIGEPARHAPGEVLLYRTIESCCARGLDTFDFGVGDARYKRSWTDREVVLVDTLVPLTAVGGVTAAVMRGKRALRDFVVSRPTLHRLVQRLRSGSAPAEDGSPGED